jgi:autotransporter-associated beta strand protein
VANFNVGSGLSLWVEGDEIATLAVGQSYPLVNWSGTGPLDGSAFTTILTHRLVGTFSVLGNTLFLTVTANAAGSPISWAAGNGTWDTITSNWVDATTAPATYFDTLDAVLFGDAGAAMGNRVVTLDDPFSPVGVTMSSTVRDYTISGLGGIGGTTGLTLGAGNTRTLTLTTANIYTGQTAINGGTLSLGNGGADGSLAAASAISVASGATFAVNQSDTVTQGTDFGAISGNGAFAQSGGGTTVLTAVNTYSGSTSVNSGNLQIGGAGRLGNGNYPGDISIAGGSSLQYASSATQTLSGIISGADSLVKQSGSGNLTLSGINAYEGGTTVNGMLSLANIAAIASTSAISMADGSVLRPTLDGVIIEAPIALGGIGTTAQINGPFTPAAGGEVETLTLNQPITGDGNLRLFGSSEFLNTNGTIVLNAQSSYTGSTELDTAGETVHLAGVNLFVKLGIANALPTTTLLTLDGDLGRGSGRTVSFDLNGFNQTLAGLASNTTLAARNQRVTNTGSLATLTIHSSSDSEFGGEGPSSTFNGNPVNPTAKITGNLALTKTGTAKFTLLGVHEYTGDTTVSQGILSQSAENTFNNASTVTIDPSAELNLNFVGTDTVGKLFIGSTQLAAPNVYGKPGSVFPVIGIDQITGDGTLTVTTGPGGDYATWADTNAGGQGPELDFDNDRVRNGVEFFMNAAAGFTANPQLNASKTITWPNGGKIPASQYGTQFVVQTSSNLSLWTDVLIDDPNLANTDGSLSYTLTGGSPEFVRLSVTPN